METYYLRLTVQAFLFPNNHSLKIREDSHWLCLRNCPIWANPYGQLGHMPTLQRVGKRVGIIIDNSIRSDRVRELELPPPPPKKATERTERWAKLLDEHYLYHLHFRQVECCKVTWGQSICEQKGELRLGCECRKMQGMFWTQWV